MTTPADELRQAADTLAKLTAAATNKPWRLYDRNYPHLVLQGPADAPASEADGFISTNLAVNEAADAAYIAAMHPGVGTALAAWLDSWTGIDLYEAGSLPEDAKHALAVARQINAASA